MVANPRGQAVRVLADVCAAARKPGFRVGDEPSVPQHDAQQLPLRARAATSDAATFGRECRYWPSPPGPLRSSSVTAATSTSSCALRPTAAARADGGTTPGRDFFLVAALRLFRRELRR